MQLGDDWPSQSGFPSERFSSELVKRLDLLAAELHLATDGLKAALALTTHHHCECAACVRSMTAIRDALDAVDGVAKPLEITLCHHRVAHVRGEPRHVWVECDSGDNCVFKDTRKTFKEIEEVVDALTPKAGKNL